MQEHNLKARVSTRAALHVCHLQASSWVIRAQPRSITELPRSSRVELCNTLLLQAVPSRQQHGWKYGGTGISKLREQVREGPADLPYVSPKNMSTAQQAALLGLLVKHLHASQQSVSEHARRYLSDRIGTDLELALAILGTAFGAEPTAQSTAQQGNVALQCLLGSSKLWS